MLVYLANFGYAPKLPLVKVDSRFVKEYHQNLMSRKWDIVYLFLVLYILFLHLIVCHL